MTKAQTVLLVEDDDWFREQQARTLAGSGFVVEQAPNGLVAIDTIDTKPPDCIVLDLFLPGPNALVLMHELQSYSDSARIPIVMCTSGATDIPTEWLEPYGVKVVVDKTTMLPDDLVNAVKRVLS